MNLAHNHTITRKEEMFNRELELINVKISNEKELHQLKMKQELFEIH